MATAENLRDQLEFNLGSGPCGSAIVNGQFVQTNEDGEILYDGNGKPLPLCIEEGGYGAPLAVDQAEVVINGEVLREADEENGIEEIRSADFSKSLGRQGLLYAINDLSKLPSYREINTDTENEVVVPKTNNTDRLRILHDFLNPSSSVHGKSWNDMTQTELNEALAELE